MSNIFDDESATFVVLVNDEGQYSLWPETVAIPGGWAKAHAADSRQNCLAYIKQYWVDMRPRSLILETNS
jgi:uncharacterized protein YbdZ (MbtH family)